MDLEHKLADGRVEARSVAFNDVDTSKDGGTFTGYAAVFDHEADIGDFTESIMRGAFRKSIPASGNVPMLYDHNPALPVLATTGGGTLKLKEDGKGLFVEARVANHYMGEAVRELVKRGDIRGMSFGFIAGQGNSRIERRSGSKPHRTLSGFQRLLDVSPTWDPAYEATSAELRSLRALEMAHDLSVLKPRPVEFRSTVEEVQTLQDRLSELQSHVEALLKNAVVDDEPVVSPPTPAEPVVTPQEPVQEPGVQEDADEPVTAPQTPQDPQEQDPPDQQDQEQRSGVDPDNGAAARRRRLHMMELSLPKGDLSWMTDGSTVVVNDTTPPPRSIDDLLDLPRQTWTVEEQRHVIEHRKQVHAAMFALVSEAERRGRPLTAEEAQRHQDLERQFQRLAR
jgi:HK97 family phage prohead protease